MSRTFETRLSEMGLTLPKAPVPAGSYVAWVRSGDLVFVSGQVSRTADGLIRGKLGETLGIEGGAEAARASAIDLLAQLKAACDGDLDRLVRVVKLTGFVNSTADFVDQPAVIDGASDLLGEAFEEIGRHARSAVSVASLPFGAAVELEAVFEIR